MVNGLEESSDAGALPEGVNLTPRTSGPA
ncbi:MAG: hypothetical protein JWL70_1846, partial [Acidimicrobiia bacterium]|nr:hypothetical protein [Acidimicrobiia bacterium]